MAADLAREHTAATLGAMATALGYRKASRVSRACRRVEQAQARSSLARDLGPIRRALDLNH